MTIEQAVFCGGFLAEPQLEDFEFAVHRPLGHEMPN